MRGEITLAPDATEEEAVSMVKNNPVLSVKIVKEIKKTIYVPGRIINFIINE